MGERYTRTLGGDHMKLSRSVSKKRAALAGLGIGAMALVGAACAPATPPATTVPTGNTTTTNVNYACVGLGLSSSAVIANQTTSVAITLPTSATVGTPFSVGVDVGNLNLSAAPSFLDLNSAGVVATIAVAGANANASTPANNFVGNGASIDLNAATTTATATSAGTKTVTVGQLTLVVGSTGFQCTPTGSGASASVTAS